MRQTRVLLVGILIGALSCGLWTGTTSSAVAQDAEAAATTAPKRTVRLSYPWNRVTDLSEEQREQILTIRQEIADQIRALRASEDERCMAVLSDAQRAELEKTLADESARRKAERAAAAEAEQAQDAASKPAE